METPVPIPLDLRKQQILKAVVSDYTRTGVPVGSHALAVHLAAWSSATIRNELANLVDVSSIAGTILTRRESGTGITWTS